MHIVLFFVLFIGVFIGSHVWFCCYVGMLIFSAIEGKTNDAISVIIKLHGDGYAATDIIQTLFKVQYLY